MIKYHFQCINAVYGKSTENPSSRHSVLCPESSRTSVGKGFNEVLRQEGNKACSESRGETLDGLQV